jgi:hypothetical protein
VASGAPGESYRQLTLDGSRPRSSRVAAEEEAIRFWAKVVIDPRPGGCQHWIAAIGDDGYGRFQAGSGPTARTVRAHRWAFEVSTGLHPARRALLHACDETGCVALDHLVVGTQAENVAAMHRRGRAGWFGSDLRDSVVASGERRTVVPERSHRPRSPGGLAGDAARDPLRAGKSHR